MKYDRIPDDFTAEDVDQLQVSQIPKHPDSHTDYATRYKVIDNDGREFLVISDNTRKDDMSDHFHVSQTSGDIVIENPTLIATEMWASGGNNLPQRAILTAIREFEQLDS